MATSVTGLDEKDHKGEDDGVDAASHAFRLVGPNLARARHRVGGRLPLGWMGGLADWIAGGPTIVYILRDRNKPRPKRRDQCRNSGPKSVTELAVASKKYLRRG